MKRTQKGLGMARCVHEARGVPRAGLRRNDGSHAGREAAAHGKLDDAPSGPGTGLRPLQERGGVLRNPYQALKAM
jgi:hypothetical protein